jgi:hypothetical protein
VSEIDDPAGTIFLAERAGSKNRLGANFQHMTDRPDYLIDEVEGLHGVLVFDFLFTDGHAGENFFNDTFVEGKGGYRSDSGLMWSRQDD